jgi:hypothetical protein
VPPRITEDHGRGDSAEDSGFVVCYARRFVANSSPRPDFDWVIRARTNIQWDLLTLYKLADRNGPLVQRENDVLKASFSLLVGASFSLWRAAFLSHIDQEWSDILGGARELLDKLLTTNAVSFQTDLDCRDWVLVLPQ